jgi:hypothetical protein
VNSFGFRRHIAFGIDMNVKNGPCRNAVYDFYTADLDHTIAILGIETSCLGV